MESEHTKNVNLGIKEIDTEIEEISIRFRDFQYKLITISSITFSIYFALKDHQSTTQIKLGFLLLIISMVIGVLSLLFEYLGGMSINSLKDLKIQRFIYRNKDSFQHDQSLNAEYKRMLFYEKLYKKLDEEGNNIHKFFFQGLKIQAPVFAYVLPMLLGIAQVVVFIVGIIFLFVGLT